MMIGVSHVNSQLSFCLIFPQAATCIKYQLLLPFINRADKHKTLFKGICFKMEKLLK